MSLGDNDPIDLIHALPPRTDKRTKLHKDLDEYIDFLAGRNASGDVVVHIVGGQLRTWEFETSEKVAPWRKE